jgi:PAS domain S-box-containing protein
VEVVGSVAVAVGVEPVGIIDAATQLVVYPGVLLALQPLDNAYLAVRTSTDPTVALALVSRTSVVAQAGASIPTATLLRLAGEALDSPTPLKARQVGDRFDSVKTVLASDNTPVMALVASTPTTEVTDVRDKLFRTLFIIALGGTLLALLLAAVVGERIGAGLRTLTDAAQRIQRGEFAQPSGVRAEDEVGVLGAAFDSMALSISEQTAALQRAAEDETALRNQLEAVVAGMGEALVAVDAAGHVTLVNRAAEELLGVVANDARGRPVGEVLVPSADDGRQLMARLQRATPARWSTVATIESVDGSIPVAVSAGALRAPGGGLAGVVYVLRDLRPERQVERMKSEFLSRIGHELRTPLTAILGYAEILLHRPVPEPKVRQFHEEIHEAGKRLSRIVEMLEFSAAAEAGRSLLRPEPTSIRSLVDAVVADWKDRVNGNHAIVRRVARGLPQIVADRRWLSMSINELVDNAVKFSPEGGKVGIAAEATSYQGRPAVEISVADQGVGMSEAERDRVFAEFIQGDASDTRRFGGLGLGLSMVRRVAEAHGGTVMCTSTPRKGSKFSIVVPA